MCDCDEAVWVGVKEEVNADLFTNTNKSISSTCTTAIFMRATVHNHVSQWKYIYCWDGRGGEGKGEEGRWREGGRGGMTVIHILMEPQYLNSNHVTYYVIT